MFATWWAWVAAGLVIAIFEVVLPGYIFVGFAIGAVLTGLAIGLGLPGAGWMIQTPMNALLVFAVLSLTSWLILRYSLGVRRGQSKRIDHDINEG